MVLIETQRVVLFRARKMCFLRPFAIYTHAQILNVYVHLNTPKFLHSEERLCIFKCNLKTSVSAALHFLSDNIFVSPCGRLHQFVPLP